MNLSPAGKPLVFGVSLERLNLSSSDKVPFIVRKIVEHIEENGRLDHWRRACNEPCPCVLMGSSGMQWCTSHVAIEEGVHPSCGYRGGCASFMWL